MPKKETKTLLIVLLLIDVLYIGSFSFLYYFTRSLIAESIDVENQIKIELKKQDMKILMKDDILSGKIYQEKLAGYILPSGGTVAFIKILEQMFSSSTVKYEIKSVTNKPFEKGGPTNAEFININVDVIGEWKNIYFFLKSLENYPLKINIKKVTLSKFSDYLMKNKLVPEWHGNFEFTVVKLKDVK